MKIIFMGTPDFALPSLKALHKSEHEILAVVTGLDKQKGRGLKTKKTPVKILAEEYNLPVIQPESLKSEELWDELKSYSPDIFVVVAFRILPKKMIEIPKWGAVNLHSSLLPKYRGAAPINWAIINGDRETGVTVFRIEAKVDTGDILLQKKIAIEPEDTCLELHDKLAKIGAETLVRGLSGLERDDLIAIPQNNELASKAPKIFPEIGEIDWQKDAATIKNLIHGLSPFPGAFTFFNKKRIKILRAKVSNKKSTEVPSTIIVKDKNSLEIQSGNGVLLPLELQKAGKRALKVKDFLNGFQGKAGDRFNS